MAEHGEGFLTLLFRHFEVLLTLLPCFTSFLRQIDRCTDTRKIHRMQVKLFAQKKLSSTFLLYFFLSFFFCAAIS